jgi:hypothetical protein
VPGLSTAHPRRAQTNSRSRLRTRASLPSAPTCRALGNLPGADLLRAAGQLGPGGQQPLQRSEPLGWPVGDGEGLSLPRGGLGAGGKGGPAPALLRSGADSLRLEPLHRLERKPRAAGQAKPVRETVAARIQAVRAHLAQGPAPSVWTPSLERSCRCCEQDDPGWRRQQLDRPLGVPVLDRKEYQHV